MSEEEVKKEDFDSLENDESPDFQHSYVIDEATVEKIEKKVEEEKKEDDREGYKFVG